CLQKLLEFWDVQPRRALPCGDFYGDRKLAPIIRREIMKCRLHHACNFGFIQPSGGFADAFAHCSAIQSFGFMSVEEGQSVEYKIEAGPPKDAVMGDEDLAGNHSLLRLL
ncbi:cold shock domain-containing protein, partial [Glutamicibacter sp.]|uniref:cold shock domain-containing protein n=1 Tax=Glutamicibacter sp. TaxID=1931995 RepID=UPI003FA5E153